MQLRSFAWLAGLLGLAASVNASGPFEDAQNKLARATTPEQVDQVVRSSPVLGQDQDIQDELDDTATASVKAQKLRSMVALKALAEGARPSGDAAKAVSQIKNAALYRDPGVKQESNWLGRALERLKNLIPKWPPRKPRADLGSVPVLGELLVWFVWVLLACAVAALVIFAALQIRIRSRAKRRVSAMIDEGEEMLTLDEWLSAADNLCAQGNYREAVRALYVACLLRFDEARVARFDRGQTNWEHLVRIETSPRLPAGIEFRRATQMFDVIWYGMKPASAADVEQFRSTNTKIWEALAKSEAA